MTSCPPRRRTSSAIRSSSVATRRVSTPSTSSPACQVRSISVRAVPFAPFRGASGLPGKRADACLAGMMMATLIGYSRASGSWFGPFQIDAGHDGKEEGIFPARLAIGQFAPILHMEHRPAGGVQHRMAGGRIPFHGPAETRIEIRLARSQQAEFERGTGGAELRDIEAGDKRVGCTVRSEEHTSEL